MDDMTQISREVVAGLINGTSKPEEIQVQVELVWVELTANADTCEQIANVLGVKSGVVQAVKHVPVLVASPAAGIGALDVTVVVLAWVGTDVVLGAFTDLAKDEIKKRIRNLWYKVILPKLKKRMSRDELGTDAEL